jgi:hypothetical protein
MPPQERAARPAPSSAKLAGTGHLTAGIASATLYDGGKGSFHDEGREGGTAMQAPSAINRAIRVVLATLLLAGCASVAPTRITSVGELAGNWQGTITQGFNGPQQLYYLTIHPDGSMVAQWGPNWQWGKVTVNNGGAATFEVSDIATGPLNYYAGPTGRSITMEPTFGGWYVQVTPAK